MGQKEERKEGRKKSKQDPTDKLGCWMERLEEREGREEREERKERGERGEREKERGERERKREERGKEREMVLFSLSGLCSFPSLLFFW